MYIIGERINGMFTDVARAIKEKDKRVIQELAIKQIECGADALDINIGPASAAPLETIKWLVEAVQEPADLQDVHLCIDTPKMDVMEVGVALCKNQPIINSTTAEDKKLDFLLSLAQKHSARLIALTMDEKGIPQSVEAKLELAVKIITRAQEVGFSPSDIFLDPIVLPVNVAQDQPKQLFEVLSQFRVLSDPPPHSVVGLSNISQKCSNRALINRTFLVMAMAHGLDGAILDCTDKEMMDALITAELLLNKQIYCDSYIESYRKK